MSASRPGLCGLLALVWLLSARAAAEETPPEAEAEPVPSEGAEEALPPAPPGPSAEDLAWDAFEAGRRHFEAEEFPEAAAAFERAYQLLPRPTVHFNIARSLELAGRLRQARERYRAFLAAGVGSPERRRVATERIAALSGESARLVVSTHPPGGTVFVDGRRRGLEPVSVAVRPGEHHIEVRLRGTRSRRVVDVAPGERRRLAFALHSPAGAEGRDRRGRPRSRLLHPGYFWGSIGLTGVCTALTIGFAAGSEPSLQVFTYVFILPSFILPFVSIALAYYTDWDWRGRRAARSRSGPVWQAAAPLGFAF